MYGLVILEVRMFGLNVQGSYLKDCSRTKNLIPHFSISQKTLLLILMVINCHKNNVLKQCLPQVKMSDNSLVMHIFLPRSVHAFVAEKGFVLGGEL